MHLRFQSGFSFVLQSSDKAHKRWCCRVARWRFCPSMAKRKPKPIPVKKPRNPEDAKRMRALIFKTVIVGIILGSCAAGFVLLKRHVEQRLTFPPNPPKVVLKDRPVWMSDFLAEQIANVARPKVAHSAMDHQMLVDAAELLKANPWIKQVKQVRRMYGRLPGDTLEIDCEYRAPVALVKSGDFYWLVDVEGIKLPEQYTADQIKRVVRGQDGHVSIRVIEGVTRWPPGSGQKWTGEDLQAGLDLVKLLHGQPYADEILSVNVSNFAGREDTREAQLVLGTRYGTEVRWGRPVYARDFFVEVSTAQKLEYMRRVYNEFRRVDGNRPWIDIRFDKITYPTDAHAHSQ